jgi:hypothetical protein
MTLTYGFYNAIDGDRRYDAKDLSALFDGIINDGIFMSIGDHFAVTASTPASMNIIVGTGRAWFNSSWTLNDAPIILAVDAAELVLNRIDTVVLEVNNGEEVRANSIKIVKGTPGSNPVAPIMTTSELVNQHRLCDIYVGAGATSIVAGNLTNFIGTTTTPFITGILDTINGAELLTQWYDLFETTLADNQALFEAQHTEIDVWYNNVKLDIALLQTFDFDNLAEYTGCTRNTIFNGDGSISETITKTSGGTTVATRGTVFNANGTITVTTTVYDEDGVTVLKTSTTTTTFNANGSITEVNV